MVSGNPQLLIFSQRFPPGIGGTPTVMRNLVRGLPADSVRVVSLAEKGETDGRQWDGGFAQRRLSHPGKLVRKLDPAFFSLVPAAVLAARRLMQGVKPDAVLAVYPGTCYMLAAYLYCSLTGAPLYLYFMDTWPECRGRKSERCVARWAERRMFRMARKVFALSPALQTFFDKKYPEYNDKLDCLPHSIDFEENRTPEPDNHWKREGLHIVYTGQLYQTTLDPVLLLLMSLEQLGELDPFLTISTPDSETSLRASGLLDHPQVKVVRLDSLADVLSLQASADVLFNSVSFEHRDRPQVQTLFPTKTIEYLNSGRPMIVCGPAETAFVKYTAERGFAHMVTEPDAGALASCLRRVHAGEGNEAVLQAAQTELQWRDSRKVARHLLDVIGNGYK